MTDKTRAVSDENAARAVAARLSAKTVAEAAEACGVSESTFRRWLKADNVAEMMREAVDEMVRGAVDRAVSTLSSAVDTIADVMADEDASPQVRLNAANAAINCYLRLSERRDVLSRLEALEEAEGL